MKRAARLLGAVLVGASLVFLVLFAIRNAEALPHLRWDARTAMALVAATGLYGLTFLSTAAAWHILLRGAGERPAFGTVLVILLLSQAAKYLPGNVGHYVGRVALARRWGLGTVPVLLTLAVETACAIASGVATAAALFPAALRAGTKSPWLLAVLIVGIVAAAIAGPRLAASPRLRAWARLPADSTAAMPRAGAWLACLAVCTFNFVLFGAEGGARRPLRRRLGRGLRHPRLPRRPGGPRGGAGRRPAPALRRRSGARPAPPLPAGDDTRRRPRLRRRAPPQAAAPRGVR
jgi:hypothetical protein